MLTSLSLPPFNYVVINFLTFSLFYIFLIKKIEFYKNKRIFFLYGWLFGFGYFGSNLYWISISLTFDQNFKSLIPLTTVLIPSFLAIFYGLISLFFKILNQKNILSSFLVFSLIFLMVFFDVVALVFCLPRRSPARRRKLKHCKNPLVFTV